MMSYILTHSVPRKVILQRSIVTCWRQSDFNSRHDSGGHFTMDRETA